MNDSPQLISDDPDANAKVIFDSADRELADQMMLRFANICHDQVIATNLLALAMQAGSIIHANAPKEHRKVAVDAIGALIERYMRALDDHQATMPETTSDPTSGA